MVLKPESDTLDVRNDRFDWSAEYLEQVFKALVDAVEENAGEKGFWKSLRWMPYDKVCASKSVPQLPSSSRTELTAAAYRCLYAPPQYAHIFARGLRYDLGSRTWSDRATEWLQGRMSSSALKNSLRGLCQSGRRYNNLLPDPRAGARPSSAPPRPGPVAGPSSSAMIPGSSTAPY